MTGVIGALKDVYELGFAIWDLSPETLLLDIGLAFEVINNMPEEGAGGGAAAAQGGVGNTAANDNCNFASLDSLRRN